MCGHARAKLWKSTDVGARRIKTCAPEEVVTGTALSWLLCCDMYGRFDRSPVHNYSCAPGSAQHPIAAGQAPEPDLGRQCGENASARGGEGGEGVRSVGS